MHTLMHSACPSLTAWYKGVFFARSWEDEGEGESDGEGEREREHEREHERDGERDALGRKFLYIHSRLPCRQHIHDLRQTAAGETTD